MIKFIVDGYEFEILTTYSRDNFTVDINNSHFFYRFRFDKNIVFNIFNYHHCTYEKNDYLFIDDDKLIIVNKFKDAVVIKLSKCEINFLVDYMNHIVRNLKYE